MTRKAAAIWKGSIKEGEGAMKVESGAFEGKYSFSSRFEDGTGTNPEELIGAAHAGCFSMALSLMLGEAGYTPDEISTRAEVTIEKKGEGFAITGITLNTEASIPNIDEETFMKHAQNAKEGCPVSQALAGTNISLNAKLK
jgi:lipoyl-dependent peroxiredoxin